MVVLAIAAATWFLLLPPIDGNKSPDTIRVQLDLIRTAGALLVGTGGAVALLLAARRQRYVELSLVHTDRDATERRITELYTKAADQLGSEHAPVRLAGLYALERLAHSTVKHRQAIVDVVCAYLRMPYTPPQPSACALGWSYRSPGPPRRRRAHKALSDQSTHTTRQEYAVQEQQVRRVAEDILLRNLRYGKQLRRRWWHRTSPQAPAWPEIRLNLASAILLEFSLRNCQLDYPVDFTGAQFVGKADFVGAQFRGGASFVGTQFTAEADFEDAQFAGNVSFVDAQFSDSTDFGNAQFTGMASFANAEFIGEAQFMRARFIGKADFVSAQFTSKADFVGAQFIDEALFMGAQFISDADFNDVRFIGSTDFDSAQFNGKVNFAARVASTAALDAVWPPGWRTRSAESNNGEDAAFLYLINGEEGRHPDRWSHVSPPDRASP